MNPRAQVRYYRTQTDEVSPKGSIGESFQRRWMQLNGCQDLYYSNTSSLDCPGLGIGRVPTQKLERIQQELNHIERLKSEYQKRNQGKIRPFNCKYSDISKSVDKKHELKPSQSPVVARKDQIGKKSKQNIMQIQDSSQLEVMREWGDGEVESLKREIEGLRLDLIEKDHVIEYLRERISQLEGEMVVKEETIKEKTKSKDQVSDELGKMMAENEQIERILKNMLYEREKGRFNMGVEEGKNNDKVLRSSTCSNTPNPKPHTNPNKNSKRPDDLISDKTLINPFQKVTISSKNSINQIIIQRKSRVQQTNPQEQQKRQRVQSILQKLKIKINKY